MSRTQELFEEFSKTYKAPQLRSMTVGFCGIDPQEKVESSGGTTNHEELENLYGGDSTNGHWHLTAAEYEKLIGYPYYQELLGRIMHNSLTDLQGGQAGEYYHLKSSELEQLGKVITEFVIDGEFCREHHEELRGLQGGKDNEHFHLTNDQLGKLIKVLDILYPDGAEDPVFPYTPVNPDNPDNPDPAVDPFGGLPGGTPPNWEMAPFPSGYTAWPYNYKMYAGDFDFTTSTLNIPSGLLIPMKPTNASSNNAAVWRLSSDLSTWITRITNMATGALGDCHDYLLNTTGSPLYILYSSADDYKNRITFVKKGVGNIQWLVPSSGYQLSSGDEYVAAAYSSAIGQYIFISAGGQVTHVTSSNSLIPNQLSSIGMNVNPNSAAYSLTAGIFCVSGPEGTATSSDGKSWVRHTNAKGLLDLTYREDLGRFVARGEDKLFYSSANGADWEAVENSTPIPLETVSCVDYSSELGWYCAIGGTSNKVYFSKNLKSWVATNITNGAAIEMNSVKYMPSTNKYVLMPKSGNYYYTFDVGSWKDE